VVIKEFADDSTSVTNSKSFLAADAATISCQSDATTISSPSFRAFSVFVYGSEKDEVLSELVSSLQETSIQQENTIQQLLCHIAEIETQLQSQSESKKAELIECNQKPRLDPPGQSDDWKGNLYQLHQQNN
jgi:hypothetical protein